MEHKIILGTIKEVVDSQNFIVVLQDGSQVLASLSFKMKNRMSNEILTDEEVAIELSPYDKSKGRITYKHSVMNKYFNTNNVS